MQAICGVVKAAVLGVICQLETFTCFRSLKLNSHSASGRVPETFLTQKSEHCNRKHKATLFYATKVMVKVKVSKNKPSSDLPLS